MFWLLRDGKLWRHEESSRNAKLETTTQGHEGNKDERLRQERDILILSVFYGTTTDFVLDTKPSFVNLVS